MGWICSTHMNLGFHGSNTPWFVCYQHKLSQIFQTKFTKYSCSFLNVTSNKFENLEKRKKIQIEANEYFISFYWLVVFDILRQAFLDIHFISCHPFWPKIMIAWIDYLLGFVIIYYKCTTIKVFLHILLQ